MPNDLPFLYELTAIGEGAPTVDEKCQIVEAIREHSPEFGPRLDRFWIEHIASLGTDLLEARGNQEELKRLLEKLTADPWHSAIFLRPISTSKGPRAVVAYGNSQRVVGFADGVAPEDLLPGETVFLAPQLNVVMEKSEHGGPQCGETASFEQYTPDGRMVLKWRDDRIVVDVAGTLKDVEVKPGEDVRWDRTVWMAFERVERAEGRRFIVGEVPAIGPDQVGGQDKNLETIIFSLTANLIAPNKAAQHGLTGRHSILMVGPPGCGKTLMAKVAAAEIKRISGKRTSFAAVKPGEWKDPYVGVTERNIRECFGVLREAAEEGFAVLFLDEIESVGRTRGGPVGRHDDSALGALLTELDGFKDRTGVAIIAASNRKDLIDPALIDRLSDEEIQVDRPDMRGARSIFAIHLPPTRLYSSNGSSAEATRQEIIETAVSRLYSPNGENELCVVRFRDGKTRTVVAHELASGRMIEQVCRAACKRAFFRDIRGDEPTGLCVADIEDSLSNAMERLRTTLTPRNVHAYLTDLPQDVDVVSVEPVVRKVGRPHRYLNLSVAE